MATITTKYLGDMLFETAMGNHKLTIDVPDVMGGSDRGPQPPQIFIASLGSCVAALVTEYAERKGLDTSGLTVGVDFEKASAPTRLTNIKIHINMPNATCSDREGAIRKVAEHCPVHETMVTLEGIEFEIHDESELKAVP